MRLTPDGATLYESAGRMLAEAARVRLLLGGEVPGAPVIGEFVAQQEFAVVVR